MLEFTVAFKERVERKQKSRLAELVATLEHDAKAATQPRATAASRSPSSSISSLGKLGIGFIGGLLGAAIGAIVGSALYTGPNDFLESNGADWAARGAVIGLVVGAVGLPLLVSWLDARGSRRRPGKRWP
jgi:hypothetical protein